MANMAIITAGGNGRRLPGPTKKQYYEILGKPLLMYALECFTEHPRVQGVILVLPAEDVSFGEAMLRQWLPSSHRVTIVPGGKERQDSVDAGLATCPEDTRLVLIHDGVRPLVHAEDIDLLLDLAATGGAAIPVTPVKYTVKRVLDDRVQETVPRDDLVLVHTPQVFDFQMIRHCHELARNEGLYATDDAALAETYGYPVRVLRVAEPQIKITEPSDLPIAELLIQRFVDVDIERS